MRELFLILLLLAWNFYPAFAQKHDTLLGAVYGLADSGSLRPLHGAHVYWANQNKGSYSDSLGIFVVQKDPRSNQLVASFTGWQNDTIFVSDEVFVRLILQQGYTLSEVEIEQRLSSMRRSFSSALNEITMGENELLKAACCNLSESFETNPSVDISFTDAITGTRQIQMLGLNGNYTQITRESMPNVRGFAVLDGLTFTPGPWISSVQMIKGTGTVANGFESIAGQINVELRKPEYADKLFLNVYGNEMGRFEANLNLAFPIKNSHWSTALLLHADQNQIAWDRNDDGFLDRPLGRTFSGVNRWKYIGPNGWMLQFGIKGISMNQQGGEVDFNPDTDALGNERWGMKNDIQRIEGWTKIGRVFVSKPWKSYGLQLSGLSHRQDTYFGQRPYVSNQNSAYANFIYQSRIRSSKHTFKSGMSWQFDAYEENFDGVDYSRDESVPGIFGEYTYKPNKSFTAVAGLRGDLHSLFGFFVTPRVHIRYAFSDQTVARLNVGRGQRTANIFSENRGIMASARNFVLWGDPQSNYPYGLNPEIAWNAGINFNHTFMLGYRPGTIAVDFYHTFFENQIVVDRDANPQAVLFYNLDGNSFSNSFQIQLDYELLRRLDLRLAYRWFQVQTDYAFETLVQPFISAHRAFANLAYQTRNYWKWDVTINWQGPKRIPNTRTNPLPYQLQEYSPDFVLIHAQVTKVWAEKFEVYVGVENLLNFRQKEPILAGDDPFGPYFDASLTWGPIFGRNIYAGIRYTIP